ncbi:MAG: adenosylcobinamide-GDP ribazoletransferase [Pseudomonadota bacterium]
MASRTRIEAHDIWVAFSLLSRLPVPVDHSRAGERMAAAVWAWPVVGAVIGAAMGCAGELAFFIGLPPSVAAVCAITVGILATGALHEDGLADCADGFGGGQTKERVLEIMKDSRIGAFGAVAIVLALLARFAGLSGLEGTNLVATLAVVGAISRTAMALVMRLPNARGSGLSASVGQTEATGLWLAVGVTLILGLLLLSSAVFAAILGAIFVATPLVVIASKRIGGQTGDVLGGVQVLAEIGAILGVLALLA